MDDPKPEELAEQALSDPDEEGNCPRCGEEIVLECMADEHVFCNPCAQEVLLILAGEIREQARERSRISNRKPRIND